MSNLSLTLMIAAVVVAALASGHATGTVPISAGSGQATVLMVADEGNGSWQNWRLNERGYSSDQSYREWRREQDQRDLHHRDNNRAWAIGGLAFLLLF